MHKTSNNDIKICILKKLSNFLTLKYFLVLKQTKIGTKKDMCLTSGLKNKESQKSNENSNVLRKTYKL